MADDTELSIGDKPKNGVRRVNNFPLIIAVVAVGIFVLLVAMVAVKRANKVQNEEDISQTSNKNTDTSTMAMSVVAGRCVGLIPSETPEPLPEPTEKFIDNLPSLPIGGTDLSSIQATQETPIPTEPDPVEQQRHAEKMQQFQEAVRAKTAIPISSQLTSNSVSGNHSPQNRDNTFGIDAVQQEIDKQASIDLNLDYQAQVSKIQSSIAASQLGAQSGSTLSTRNDINQFANKEQTDRWQLNEKMQAPRSAFEIRAGGVIPGVMISGVNSDLPGQIMGQVSQDVYDTATGKYLLIPQGTRLLGAYTSDVAYGQSAVMIAWQRLIFPDGKALDISAMPGADNAGYSGFRDQVNNHYFRIFSSALLMSVVTAGISYSQDQDNSGNKDKSPNMNSQMSQALGQQFGQVITKMIEKNLNIAPTLEIRPGYRFNIIIIKDITFTKAYQSFDY